MIVVVVVVVVVVVIVVDSVVVADFVFSNIHEYSGFIASRLLVRHRGSPLAAIRCAINCCF